MAYSVQGLLVIIDLRIKIDNISLTIALRWHLFSTHVLIGYRM